MDPEIKSHVESVQAETLKAIEGLKTQWKAHYEELKADGAKSADVLPKIDRALKRLDEVEAIIQRPVGTSGAAYSERTLGQTVVESDGLKEFLGRMKASDGKSGYARGMSYTVPFQSLFAQAEQKTTITSALVGNETPGILQGQRLPGIVKPGIRRVRVRDLMPRYPTTSNLIEFVKENAFTNAASPVAETISKPESALTFTIDSEPVRTIAHWIPAAKQILDDFGQLQAYIDQRLLEGLKDEEDTQILTGDGAGAHLNGLIMNCGTYDTARNVASDTYIDKLNHAISQIEDVNLYPSGIVLAPRDWRTIQLIKEENGSANTGPYLLGGPAGNATPMLWGLPVATSTAMTVGKFFVGAFDTYCAVWDRMDARVDVSSEHSDYFIRNMVAIRAEERLALTVLRDDAVLYGSFA